MEFRAAFVPFLLVMFHCGLWFFFFRLEGVVLSSACSGDSAAIVQEFGVFGRSECLMGSCTLSR